MGIDRSKVSKQAENYLASNKFDRALELFQQLLEDRPDDFHLMNRMGDICLQANRLQEAIELFRKAAAGFERDGFNSRATAVLKKALRAAPEDVDVAGRLAELYRQSNMIKDAIQIHIHVADLFTKKGLIKRALEEFAKIVELDPKNLKNKVKLADLYNKEGMQEKAAGIYLEVSEALALDHLHAEAFQVLERARVMITTPQLYLTHSRLCIIKKDHDEAVKALEEGLERNPRNTDILEALAEVQLQAHRPEAALERLAQVPQLADKTLNLCERGIRDLIRSDQADVALRLFAPIGRELSRRGNGDMAARALQNGMHGRMTLDAWLMVADFQHQSGNKTEQADALRQALTAAHTSGNQEAATRVTEQLMALGVEPATYAAQAPRPSFQDELPTASGIYEQTEIDPVRRMQLEQLIREAESFVRNRFLDRAQEAYQRILELDPSNRDAIARIAEIITSTGRMTAVQTHYVRVAERLAAIGKNELALECLDKAEALFPGSTRLYRRNLGLLPPPPSAAQGTLPSAPPSAMPDRQSPIALGEPAQSDLAAMPLIPLDLPGQPSVPFAPPQEVPAAQAIDAMLDLGDALPVTPWDAQATTLVPRPESMVPPAEPTPLEMLPEALSFEELPGATPEGWTLPTAPAESLEPLPALEDLPPLEGLPGKVEALTPEDLFGGPSEPEAAAATATERLEISGLPPLELEPLTFAKPVPTFQAPPPEPVSIPDELASLLPDIDFQMDYGSPEEAKIAIEEAMQAFPGHPELLSRLQAAETALHRLGHARGAEPSAQDEFSGGFFDLTDVLGSDLAEGEGEEMHDATRVVEKVQSVEELFDAFREGVEQQVRGDDYDTHYNLGIAYKEMLLIEPAIEEFKKAMDDPERTLECCSMLAICEMERGDLDAAERWLRQGIDSPGFPPEDSVGLRYDLAEVLVQRGQKESAEALFRQVYDMDPEYRDVADRI